MVILPSALISPDPNVHKLPSLLMKLVIEQSELRGVQRGIQDESPLPSPSDISDGALAFWPPEEIKGSLSGLVYHSSPLPIGVSAPLLSSRCFGAVSGAGCSLRSISLRP